MAMTDMDDTELERHFSAARSQNPTPGPDLISRAMMDAVALQPAPVPTEHRAPGRLSALLAWLSAAAMPVGLATATLAGVWIGFSGSDTVALQAAGLMETDFGLELVYRFPAIGDLFGEI